MVKGNPPKCSAADPELKNVQSRFFFGGEGGSDSLKLHAPVSYALRLKLTAGHEKNNPRIVFRRSFGTEQPEKRSYRN